jgi:hypothetical protein
MSPAAKRYRVPCQCSAEVAVGPGQAGDRVVCPACGGAIDVPRLRDLEAFAVAVSPTASRGWRACHGWLLLAATVAATAGAAAAVLGAGGMPAAFRLPDAEAIRAAVDSADAATIYKAWQAMRFSGVDRGALAEELRLQRSAGVAAGLSRMLWAIATLAGLVAAATAILCLAGDRDREQGAGRSPPAGSAA